MAEDKIGLSSDRATALATIALASAAIDIAENRRVQTSREPDGWYTCECGCTVGYDELYGGGWSIQLEDYQIPFNACPNCGRKVER